MAKITSARRSSLGVIRTGYCVLRMGALLGQESAKKVTHQKVW